MPDRRQVMARPIHSEHVLQQLNNQREWGFLCDCSISVGDVDFRAHKAVLAACSSYFRMMFIKDQRARLDLSNMPVSAECFDLILQLMYLGRTITEPSDFEELKVAMAYLQMYYIPDSLEDLRGNQSSNANLHPPSSSSSTSCSSSSSSSPSLGPAEAKMMFGVRLYEQPRRNSAEGECLLQHTLGPTPVLLGPAPGSQVVAKPPAEEAMATPLAPRPAPVDSVTERPCDLRKRPPGRRAPARERPRFGRTFTCDDCGFVFSCEKLLVEHGLTCTNRKAFQTPEAQARAHGAPVWGDASAFDGSEGPEWREGDDWSERGPDPSMESPIRSVGTGTDSGPTRNGTTIKLELEEISTMDGVTAVRVGESGEDDGALSPRYKDEKKEQCPFSQGDEELGVSGVEDGSAFEGPGTVAIKREEQGSECAPCELCGAPLEEEDRSAHYISSHMPHICACGRCGQIFVRGRQLQEHAERCGELRDAAAGSPVEADGQGWAQSSVEEGLLEHGRARIRCAHCGLPLESEKMAARHAAHCPEREAETGGGGRAYRQRHGAGPHRKGLYERGGPREPRYSRRLLRDRHLRPRTGLGQDAPRYCSPATSAAGTPPSSTTTCAT
ncbi:hypothetical protein SKAU_G00156750 [Synaphobranchus kaupii]|uniref:Zinc finger and BTB domain-containing protein 1 n=1 Tax=Synaphobranchus kaupii TaxID=118154 RepID=A0A9Q1FI97_SYNKA|nr:hypothetical protein SKAU_G00156750 [Synaphobranchus kaupii]